MEEKLGKFKRWFLENFAKTAFNKDRVFPAISGPAAHIHLKETAVPKARHRPIPVPFNFKEPVRQALWKDMEKGITFPVPVSMPTDWCSTMVITAKKYGNPRKTGLPFQLVLQVPLKTEKSILDAINEYHSIPLDKESHPLTTFIIEWGKFRYLRMPQGYLASGDTYTRKYDEIIKDIPCKVKIVNDTLLYDSSIERAFYHIFDFPLQCVKNGIKLNRQIPVLSGYGTVWRPTNNSCWSDPMIQVMLNFPVPRTITDTRPWLDPMSMPRLPGWCVQSTR